MDVLCSDKTGTLTQNKLTLGEPFAVGGVPTRTRSLLAAALASRAEDQDPIDLAVLGGLKDRQALDRLSGDPLPAVRPGAQAHRGDGARARTAARSRSPRARRR